MRRPTFAALCALSASSVALAACLDNPDSGTAKQTLSGVGIDGYLAGAVVYADLNDNNQLDDPEPRARTDRDGYFSYNPETGVNYCDSGPQKHCLALSPAQSSATIRIVGGTDMATGTQFDGEITAEIANDGEPESPAPTSPLTALREAVAANTDTTLGDILAARNGNIGADDIDSDFWADGGTSMLIEYAIRAQKAVDLVASKLEDHYDLSDSGYYDLTSFVYAGLAEYWSNTNGPSLANLLQKTGPDADATETRYNWLQKAEDNVRSALDVSASKNRRVDDKLATRVRAIAKAVDDAFNGANDDEKNNKAGAKAAATMAKIARDTSDPDTVENEADNKTDDIVDAIKTEETDSDGDGQPDKEVDVDSLADDLKDSLDTADIGNTVKGNAVKLRFPELAGTEFNVRNTENGVTKVFAAFFQGSSSNSGNFLDPASSDLVEDGDLTVCRAKYDGALLEETPNRLTGSWERLTDRLVVADLGIGGVDKTSNIRIASGNTVFDSGSAPTDIEAAIQDDKPGAIDWNYSVTIGGDETEGKLSDNFSGSTPPNAWKLFEPRSASLPKSPEACRCLLDSRFSDDNNDYTRSDDSCDYGY